MATESEGSGSYCDGSDEKNGVREDEGHEQSKEKPSKEERESFANAQTRCVFFLRLTVLLVLLVAATAVSIVVFKVTDSAEYEEFESDFAAAADKITETFIGIAEEKMGAAASLEVAIVAYGVDQERSWPFVTLSSFQQRCAEIKRLSGALYIGMNPLVKHEDREEWEYYSNYHEDAKWYEEGRQYQRDIGFDDLDNRPQVQTEDPNLDLGVGIANRIYSLERTVEAKAIVNPVEPDYLPIWQTSPVTARSMVNQNRASNSAAARIAIESHAVVFEGMQYSEPGFGSDSNPVTAEIAWLLRLANRERTRYDGDIFTTVYFPLFSNFTSDRTTVGVMRIIIHWARYFRNVLPASSAGVIIVLDNQCDQPYTYRVDGGNVIPLGHGDLHEKKFEKYERTASFNTVLRVQDGTKEGLAFHNDNCSYGIRVYPSSEFYDEYSSDTPMVITVSVATVFAFMILMFLLYDRLVEWRQVIMLKRATQTHEIVASLFPKAVRDRMLQDVGNDAAVTNKRLKAFMGNDEDDKNKNQAPIADLFPNSTVLFADLVGFTAWSSSREPTQVFVLLQTLYKAFDDIATKRGVFKVETVGDCYVAASGLPDPRPDHALIMTRFATDCLIRTVDITRDLETTLGPDTGELSIRIGINSGPVIAGVLRGERSRFQLFGDTVNTAARMESTGIPGKIQVSQSTADLLVRHGKEHWLEQRQDDVVAKGKGVLRTYFVSTRRQNRSSTTSSSNGGSGTDNMESALFDIGSESLMKHARLVEWMAETLQYYVHQIGIKHKAMNVSKHGSVSLPRRSNSIVIDEVVDTIQMPTFGEDFKQAYAKFQNEQLSDVIKKQVHEYVTIIAAAYRQNPFHNFEHVCHMTMNVCKFLKRIIAADKAHENNQDMTSGMLSLSSLHEYTHEINDDPTIVFGIVFSALIHDVDHRGVSNTQFMKEEPHLADHFKHRSALEQNSFAIAWNLLSSDQFRRLRNYLFATPEEFELFRQVVVNCVMATDIFDKEMSEMRKSRWTKAFGESTKEDSGTRNDMKATIVMEHVIQASDVCHTMQHWHVYRKWNKRLFHEMLVAHRSGRMKDDPSDNWYRGELAFFDNYVIPLAKKLEECRVFGVSSDECLNYALRNRDEWEAKGQQIVEEMIEEFALPNENARTPV